ncbi:MAG: chromosome segregation protein SMC [Desulfosalsimonas sp.]
MQLKKLEIYGFKSFAEKCVISFPPGISSVVGPNGCGKSNIIDAIKWVMGEQSVRQLRGKSMGDVIFSGTDKKAPVNMAEVSLTIADVSEQAPAAVSAYSEIMITRRLYRSGESQYLLNKQPCRLKDIHDIFLRHGMGSRSCAIIQQGNIGAITDASAEERRTFIEEAAGVVRYKNRRQEATAKVKSTRENLTRINDILEEIETQLQSLSEEAQKAKQYKEYRSRLKETDFLITVYYYEDYAKRISENKELLYRLKEKDTVSEETLKELNAALQDIETRRAHKEEEIANLRGKKSESQSRKERLEGELQHLNDQQNRLEEEISELEHSLDEAEAKSRKIESEIEQGEEKTAELESAVSLIRTQLQEQESVSKDDRARLDSLKKQLAGHRKNHADLASRQARYQNTYHSAAAGKDHVKRRLKQVESEKAETEKNIAELEKTEVSRRKHQKQLQETRDRLADEIERCREALKVESRRLDEQTKSINELSARRSKLKSKLNVLNRMQSNFEWYKDGVRAVMKAGGPGGDGRIDGCLEIIADLIEPETGYEIAAEAALGESLQYIVVSDSHSGIRALEFLKQNKSGRGGFIPADIKRPAAAGTKRLEGIEPLCSRIRVREGFENVIETLIGDAGVARDLETAIAGVGSDTGLRMIVTKNGDIANSSGVIIGGSTDKMAGILEKKQEVRQLGRELDETEQNLEEEKNTQKEQESAVKEHENELAGLTEKKYENDSALLEAEKEVYKTAEKLRQARERMEVVTLEHQKLQGEKDDISSELAKHEESLAEISRDMESAEKQIEEINREIESLSRKIRDFENNRNDLNLKLTKHQAELDNRRQNVDRLREFRDEGRRRIDRMHEDMEKKQQQAETARLQSEDARKKLEAEKKNLQELRERLKTERSEYEQLSARRQETDDGISRTQSELEKTREKIHQLELDLSGLHINQENLVNRFLEKYADSFERIRQQYSEIVVSHDFSIEKTESNRSALRQRIDNMGEVNLGAIEAYETQKARRDFLAGHRDDLEEALEDLENVIYRINRITRKLFAETFEAINEKFSELFPKLFNGGSAWLELTMPDKPLETGVELMIHPPGKKVSRLSLLSGGEKALSAIAFIFAIFLLNPAAFCLLDEIDAPLDDINVERFNELLRIIGEKTQIIMISHNRKTMEFSDMLFGVTMAQSGVSRIISVNIEEAVKINAENVNAQDGKGTGHARALN